MASKKGTYLPKHQSLPTLSRNGKNLGKYNFKNCTVMYCWFVQNVASDYVKEFAEFSAYFVVDLLSIKGKRISVRIAPDAMKYVLEQCDEAMTKSNFDSAEEIVLDSYKDVAERDYYSIALRQIDPLLSILTYRKEWGSFRFLATEILSAGFDTSWDEAEERATIRKLEAHLERLHQAERAIVEGKMAKASVFIDDYQDTYSDENGRFCLPDNVLRISCKFQYGDGLANQLQWEFLAKRDVSQFLVDDQEIEGEVIYKGGLPDIKGQPIVVSLSDCQFRQLADSIRSCIADLE